MKTQFIAEVSSNHNQDLSRSLKFIETAKEIGCDGVKFQLFKVEELFHPAILQAKPELMVRKKWELPLAFLEPLSKYAHDLDMSFGCTPFYLQAVDELLPYVDFYKIASYELLWLDLFRKCALTGKPLVFSTGMSTLNEIQAALHCIADLPARDLTILHCTSAYPTPAEQANLKAIETIRKQMHVGKDKSLSVGYSDHTVLPAVILSACIQYQASMIEFHFDLDGKGAEFSSHHCWLPDQIAPVIQYVRQAGIADGNGDKTPSASELADRDWRADPEDGLRPLKNIRKKYEDKVNSYEKR